MNFKVTNAQIAIEDFKGGLNSLMKQLIRIIYICKQQNENMKKHCFATQ